MLKLTIADQARKPRSQIFISEISSALSAVWSLRDDLQGLRLPRVVDNQAALASLIGGAAADPDTASSVACLYQLLLVRCGICGKREQQTYPAAAWMPGGRRRNFGRCRHVPLRVLRPRTRVG